jgi:hypothetical protein
MNKNISLTPSRLPQISLITSWHIPDKKTNVEFSIGVDDPPSGITLAVREGIALLDLYLLGHHDVPVYIRALAKKCPNSKWVEVVSELHNWDNEKSEIRKQYEPQKFLASLTKKEIEAVGDWLREKTATCFGGRGVGMRPRFGALATFFPNISDTKKDSDSEADSTIPRVQGGYAIQALRTSLYLAKYLGCSVVEAVGGSGTIEIHEDITHTGGASSMQPADYRGERIQSLAKALNQVYTSKERGLFNPSHSIPKIAMELEPGISFLLQNIEAFFELLEALPDTLKKLNTITLNADLAHFFILGYHNPSVLVSEAKKSLACKNWLMKKIKMLPPEEKKRIEKNQERWEEDSILSLISHIHLTDHAADEKWGGTHASDLLLGQFHSEEDYASWLKFAIEQTNDDTNFSGILAIELEANNIIDEVISNINTANRWIKNVANQMHDDEDDQSTMANFTARIQNECYEGAILVVDIGNSTQELLTNISDQFRGIWYLRKIIDSLCNTIRLNGGSIMSFNGDGFIAFFEQKQLPNAKKNVLEIINSLRVNLYMQIFQNIREQVSTSEFPDYPKIALRAGVHWGTAHIPTNGVLKGEIIGRDVVIASRICAEVQKKMDEENFPISKFPFFIAATAEFLGNTKDGWDDVNWVLKGIHENEKTYHIKKDLDDIHQDLS